MLHYNLHFIYLFMKWKDTGFFYIMPQMNLEYFFHIHIPKLVPCKAPWELEIHWKLLDFALF